MYKESNLDYLKGLIKRYEASVKTIKKAEDPKEISEQERLIHPVLREMQMVVPRICDDLNKVTRDRRKEIAEGL